MPRQNRRLCTGMTVVVLFAACSELPLVPAEALPVASVTVSPVAASITAGTTAQLTVTTTDAQGRALSGRTITWSSNSESVATVDATGLVTGVSAGGPVTITATSEGRSGTAQLTVTTAAPAIATSLVAISSATLSALAGTAVADRPAVVVRDQRDVAMPGVSVTFTVVGGGGAVTGGTAVTNSGGVATVGSWILDATPTLNTLTASVTGLPAVTFAATGTVNPAPCSRTVLTHAAGTTTNGTLAATDCMSDGVFIDIFSVALSGTNAYRFSLSATFDAFLFLGSGSLLAFGVTIAENNNQSGETTNAEIKVLLPDGSYEIGATSWEWGVTGAYQLTSEATSTDVRGCEGVYVVRGLVTMQNIQATDCVRSTGPIYADEFTIYLQAGQFLTFSMSSTAFDSFLELDFTDSATGGRTVVGSNDNLDSSGTGDARLTYAAPVTGYYTLVARTALGRQTGSYTLTIH